LFEVGEGLLAALDECNELLPFSYEIKLHATPAENTVDAYMQIFPVGVIAILPDEAAELLVDNLPTIISLPMSTKEEFGDASAYPNVSLINYDRTSNFNAFITEFNILNVHTFGNLFDGSNPYILAYY
jgi:hypothetical protein